MLPTLKKIQAVESEQVKNVKKANEKQAIFSRMTRWLPVIKIVHKLEIIK